jgi:hypothetical protein
MDRTSMLRAALLAIVAPALGCGGKTGDVEATSPSGAAGAAGGGGSAGAGGSGAAGAAAGGAHGTTPFPCENPTPIVVGGVDTGYDRCAAGQVQRRAVVTCPSLLPRPTACATKGGASQCTKDSDCTMSPNGHCDDATAFGGPGGCLCAYGCKVDQDCGAGAVCACGDPIGHCVAAACTSNADCLEGPCSTYESSPGCPSSTLACQLAKDQCGGDKDCGGGSKQCSVSMATGFRVCEGPTCAVGRPMIVGHALRIATLQARAGWGVAG